MSAPGIRYTEIAHRCVGDRTEVTRAEMAEILAACHPDDLAEVSTISGRSATGELYAGGRILEDVLVSTDESLPPSMRTRRPTPAEETAVVAEAWSAMCRGITCVSVLHGCVRHDAPGSMNPNQHAAITFMDAGFAGHETDPANYMSRHCDLLLLVGDH